MSATDFGPFTVHLEHIGHDHDLVIEHEDGWSATISTGGEGHLHSYATFAEIPWAFDVYVNNKRVH